MANNIVRHESGNDIFITANLSRMIYKFSAEMGLRRSIKANGIRRKDLFLKK